MPRTAVSSSVVPRRCLGQLSAVVQKLAYLVLGRLSVSRGTSLADFLIAPECPIEKVFI